MEARVNVGDLLETSFFQGSTVETSTEAGLLNEATWVCPSSELHADRWVMPGLVILCVHRSFDQQREVIDAVGGQAIAAVIHFGCVTDECSPEEREQILAYYDSLNIPLIKFTRRMSLINFSRHFSALINNALDEEQDQMHWIEDLCTKPYKRFHEGSRDYGVNLSYAYACVVLRRKDVSGRAQDPIGEELAFSRVKDYLTDRLSLENPRLPWFCSDHRLILFVPSPKGELAKSFRARIADAISGARREMNNGKWRVVVGERVGGLRDFRFSYEHALQTDRLLSDLRIFERISYYDDWFIHIQLLSAPREDLERQMLHTLGPILDEPDLIDSLTNYLFYGENAKLAAEMTYIHTNTMRYRLGRISELLDVDLKDPTTRFRLRIAVTIYRFLRG